MMTSPLLALISVLALSLPLIAMLITGLFKYRSFPLLCIYYAVMIFDNSIGEGYIPVSKEFSGLSAVTSNLLDPLLMLSFLTYFGRSPIVRKRILLLTATIGLFEIISVIAIGYNESGLAVALGPGLTAVVALSVLFFQHQAKLSVTKGKAIGKTVIVSALIFMYGSYFISYLMYFVFKSPDIPNSYVVLYFINIFSSTTMAVGIFVEKYRVRKLRELIIVRKEIAEIYAPVSFQPKKKSPLYFFRRILHI